MKFRRLAASTAAIVALVSGAFLYTSHPAHGSDHQDSPAVLAQPGADITDVYVFPSPENPKNVVFAMNIHPLIGAGMSQKFSLDPGVLYQFKVSRGAFGTTAPADTAIQFLAHGSGAGQTISVYGKTSPALGLSSTLGFPLGTFAYNRDARFAGGVRAFVGPRADPFFFDLFQFFKILPDRDYANPRTGDKLGTPMPTFNGFAAGTRSGPGGYLCSTAPSTNTLTQVAGGFDVISIVFEIPRSVLWKGQGSSLLHVWATTSVPERKTWGGPQTYKQIELLSRPAVKELFEVFADHAVTNVSEPYDDPTLRNSITGFMTNVAGRSPAIANVVTSVLYPNELAVDVSQPGPAAYLGVETGGATGGKFGGRGLTDDVIDTSLGVVFGGTVPALKLTPDDGKENACLANEHVFSGQGGVQSQSAFPYLATPH